MIQKKILFTCAGFGGGIGKMIRFVSSLCVNKFEKVYLLHKGRESVNDIAPNGVEEIVLPAAMGGNFLYWRSKQILDIRKELKRIHPDIVCCFGTEQALMVAIAILGLKDIKLVLCDRGDPYTMPLWWKFPVKWAFKRADNCVFQLEQQGRWYGNYVLSKSCIIPNAFIPTGPVIPYLGNRKKTIVSVGRFVAEKRYEVLIDAFNIVHKKHPEYTLILYGEGPYREKYNQLVLKYGIENYVKMPGYTHNAMDAIKEDGIFVLSSLYEGMPNTLIEALSIGIPTVSTDCTPGGPDFLTDHGRRGLLVPVNNVSSMAMAMCQIIEDPQLASNLSLLGQEIISTLDKDRIANLWSNFFESVSK